MEPRDKSARVRAWALQQLSTEDGRRRAWSHGDGSKRGKSRELASTHNRVKLGSSGVLARNGYSQVLARSKPP